MSTTAIPEWRRKLMDIWDRRDSAGFYELDELFTQERERAQEFLDYLNHLTRMIETHQEVYDSDLGTLQSITERFLEIFGEDAELPCFCHCHKCNMNIKSFCNNKEKCEHCTSQNDSKTT